MSKDDIQKIVITHLLQNSADYLMYTTGGADDLVDAALEFFENKDYEKENVDLMVPICAKALECQIIVHEQSGQSAGDMRETTYNSSPFGKELHLKFSSDHYDSILKTSTGNLQLLSSVCSTLAYEDEPMDEPLDLTVTKGYSQQLSTDPASTDDDATKAPSEEEMYTFDETYDNATTIEVESVTEDVTLEVGAGDGAETITETIAEDVTLEVSPENEETENYSIEEVQDGEVTVNDTTECTMSPNFGRGHRFPTFLYSNMQPLPVTRIPPTLNGKKLYSIKTTQANYSQETTDLWHFKMVTSTRRGFPGSRKVGRCLGGFYCSNISCNFKATSTDHQVNRSCFEQVTTGVKKCFSCNFIAARDHCTARKLVEYHPDTEMAWVYHFGNHTCVPKEDHSTKQLSVSKRIGSNTVRKTVKTLAHEEVMKDFEAGDMEKAAETAALFSNRRLVTKAQQEVLQSVQPEADRAERTSFDAVGRLKKGTDKRDKFLIYEINNSDYNEGVDYVFQTTKEMLQLGLDMDIDGPNNPLQLEDCYFDGCHSRAEEFVAFGLWTIHPSYRKRVKLASMYMRTESTVTIAKFFELWNRALGELKGQEDYKFNPRTFVCDEAGANFAALRQVYGEELVLQKRIVTCQLHFLMSARRHKTSLGTRELKRQFMSICKKWIKVRSVTQYRILRETLEDISIQQPQLKTWISWWDLRRDHCFAAYRGEHKSANESEGGNRVWTMEHGGAKTLKLVDAVKNDCVQYIQNDVDLRLFLNNMGSATGRNPSQKQRAEEDRASQMKRALVYVQMMEDDAAVQEEAEEVNNPHICLPGKRAKHKPPANQKKVNNQGKVISAKGKGKGKGKSSAKKSHPVIPTHNAVQMKINQAIVILGCPVEEVQPLLSSRPSSSATQDVNPPMVIYTDDIQGIARCQGCKQKITEKQLEAPANIAFRRSGVVSGFNMQTQRAYYHEGNIYFHLSIECLRKRDQTVEYKDCRITDDELLKLTPANLELLREKGLLGYILANKM